MILKKCRSCGGRKRRSEYRLVSEWKQRKGLGGKQICQNCNRKEIKEGRKSARERSVIEIIKDLGLKCSCGLRFNEKTFGLDKINIGLIQLWDYGIARYGVDWVKGEMGARGILCVICEGLGKRVGIDEPGKKNRPEPFLDPKVVEKKIVEGEDKKQNWWEKL